MSVFKAQAMARDLEQRINLNISGLTIVVTYDSDGFPNIRCTKAVTGGNDSVYLKIETMDNAGRIDGLGLPQRAYSPHKITMLQQNILADPGVIYVMEAQRAQILAEAVKCGTKIDIYQQDALADNITDIDSTVIAASTLLVSIKADPLNPITGSN